jgi:hypothetical protein
MLAWLGPLVLLEHVLNPYGVTFKNICNIKMTYT